MPNHRASMRGRTESRQYVEGKITEKKKREKKNTQESIIIVQHRYS